VTTVFELTLYICLTTSGFSNYSKTCDWRSEGSLFASVERCETVGRRYVGTDVLGDVVYINATHRYEDMRCVARAVSND
jgi:hypothetical protein